MLRSIALKEWAVAIQALELGKQIMILRKGGIIEETRDFRLESSSFFLYPTYEHQKKELLKDAYQSGIVETLKMDESHAGRVSITSYADAVMDLEVSDQRQLDLLFPFHIWTEHFAEERMKWKKMQPLHVLLLRVYRLDLPLSLPVISAYNGCKSWIELQIAVPQLPMTPVLSDVQYALQMQTIRDLLAR